MPKIIIKVDINKSPEAQSDVLYNNWHSDIPMAVMVKRMIHFVEEAA